MSNFRKRTNLDVFSPENLANKAGRKMSDPSDMASFHSNHQAKFQISSSQPNPTITHANMDNNLLNNADDTLGDDYDHMLCSQSEEIKFAKVTDGIDLTDLRKGYPDLPDWITGYSAFLQNNIAKDIVSDVNNAMEFNYNMLKDILKTMEDTVNDKLRKYDTQMKGMAQKYENLTIQNKELKAENASLKEQLSSQENYSRRSNLVINGVPQAHQTEDLFEWFRNFAYCALGIEHNISIERIHRIGSPPARGQSYASPILVRFSFYQDRMKVWENRKMCRDQIYISQNATPEVLEARRRLWPIANEAKSQKNESNCEW